MSIFTIIALCYQDFVGKKRLEKENQELERQQEQDIEYYGLGKLTDEQEAALAAFLD